MNIAWTILVKMNVIRIAPVKSPINKPISSIYSFSQYKVMDYILSAQLTVTRVLAEDAAPSIPDRTLASAAKSVGATRAPHGA